MTRYALRVDANQDQVISALQAAGAKVQVIGKPLDLLVGTENSKGQKVMAFFEVKDGADKRLTKFQEKFFSFWPGSEGWPVCRVDGPDAALRHLRLLQS